MAGVPKSTQRQGGERTLRRMRTTERKTHNVSANRAENARPIHKTPIWHGIRLRPRPALAYRGRIVSAPASEDLRELPAIRQALDTDRVRGHAR